MFPALAGGFLNTAPPGKSLAVFLSLLMLLITYITNSPIQDYKALYLRFALEFYRFCSFIQVFDLFHAILYYVR